MIKEIHWTSVGKGFEHPLCGTYHSRYWASNNSISHHFTRWWVQYTPRKTAGIDHQPFWSSKNTSSILLFFLVPAVGLAGMPLSEAWNEIFWTPFCLVEHRFRMISFKAPFWGVLILGGGKMVVLYKKTIVVTILHHIKYFYSKLPSSLQLCHGRRKLFSFCPATLRRLRPTFSVRCGGLSHVAWMLPCWPCTWLHTVGPWTKKPLTLARALRSLWP